MDEFNNPQSLLRNFNPNVNTAGLDEIDSLIILCEFLDSLCTDSNVFKGTAVTTPELPFSSIPALQNDQVIGSHRDGPWNANRVGVGGSPNPVDKGCQSQWHLSWWFVRKIDTYRLKLQAHNDLRNWQGVYRRPKDIISDGLCALGEILKGGVPRQSNDLLCAMVIQYAICDFAHKRGLFKDVNESSFRGVASEAMETDLKMLDTVSQLLTSSDTSSSGDASSWSSDLSFSGVGDVFTTQPLDYPMGLDNNALHDPPRHGHLPSNASFNSPSRDFPISPYLSHPQAIGGYPMWSFGTYHQAPHNNPYLFNGADQYPTIQDQTSTRFNVYGPSQQSRYSPYEAQMGSSALHRSNLRRVFGWFINGFKDCNNLLPIFSYDSIRESDNRPDSNARFLTKAETSFFHPLTTSMSQSPPDQIAQAIISTTWSLVQRNKLHSFQDTANYMTQLGRHLLPTRPSCANFARVVLETCSKASAEYGLPRIFASQSQAQDISHQVEAIARDWNGAYHPTNLLQQDSNSRDNPTLRPKRQSRASSKHPTLSTFDSLGSNERSHLNTPTEVSTALTTNTTSSVCSTATVHCPECQKSFNGKHARSHLSRHKRDHKDSNQKRCPHCSKIFNHSRTDNIRTHVRNVHQQELPKDGRKYWNRKSSPSES